MVAPHIVVVGSYATGLTMKAARIPTAGETLLGTSYRVDFGGKGSNQAVGCARLGAKVDFVASIGNDSFADMALGLYRSEGISTRFLKRSADTPTGVGFIVVDADSGQNCIVLDPGANELLSAAVVREALTALEPPAVVLTQLEIPVDAAESALDHGRSARAITILNPAPVRPLPASVFGVIDILTPNETEAKVLAGYAPDENVSPSAVAQDLLRRGVKHVVLTLGEKGALLINESLQRLVPAVPVRAVDTTGAGDAFNAGLAVALAYGDRIEAAVEFAVITGAMAVTKEGVVPSLPRQAEVSDFCRSHGIPAPAWFGAVLHP